MTRILIAQPTTGTVLHGTVGYLMALGQALSGRGIGWEYRSLALSDIALSRNIFASAVLAEKSWSHLLFIDSDMGFLPETVLGLLAFDQPVTAVACPKRYLGWQTLIEAAMAEGLRPEAARLSPQALMDKLLEYNVDLTRFDAGAWQAERRGAFLKVPAVGTGIMLIRRDVLVEMRDRGVAVARPGQGELPLLEGGKPYWDFFSPQATPDGSLMESEDITFSHRWVEGCGGEIWVDIEARIMHFGMRGHSGRYAARAKDDFPESF
ncbi:MAG: hypothetical protein AAGK00_03730 [Pseudomonadota bacterium]